MFQTTFNIINTQNCNLCIQKNNNLLETTFIISTITFFIFGLFAYFYVGIISLPNAIYLGCGAWGGAAITALVVFIIKLVKYQLKREPLTLKALNNALKGQIAMTPLYISDAYQVSVSAYQPLDLLFEHVYLGTIRGFYSTDPSYLKQYELIDQNAKGEPGIDHNGASNKKIKLVVSVTSHKAPLGELNFEPDLSKIKRRSLQLEDEQGAWKTIDNADLESIFVEIDQARLQNKAVLIHCTQGISRSPAFVCAYLMSRCHVSCDLAYNFIKTKRAVADDANFRDDLIQWQQSFRKLNAPSSKNNVYRPSSFN